MTEATKTKRPCGDIHFDKGCIECQKHEKEGLKELLGSMAGENRAMMEELESAEADANRLAVVVANAVALLHDRAPHSSTCTYIRPGVCSCGLFSLTESMGEALSLHKKECSRG